MELTFSKFLKMLLDKLWLLILITVIFGLSAYSVSSFLMRPKYQSQVAFMITKIKDEVQDVAGAKLVRPDYINYTLSDKFLKEIAKGLDDKVTIDTLKSYIEIKEADTSATAFIITVTAYSSVDAFEIAEQIEKDGPDIYKAFDNDKNPFKGSVAVPIIFAKENTEPVSPNVSLNTVLGIILGIVFGIFLIISLETIDNSIKDENDLIDNYEVPLLGVVYAHKTETAEGAK